MRSKETALLTCLGNQNTGYRDKVPISKTHTETKQRKNVALLSDNKETTRPQDLHTDERQN